jgi:hypothetical protein
MTFSAWRRWALLALAVGFVATADSQSPMNETNYFGQPTRSPALAFAMSGAVPGAGQFYAGSKRGILYLAAEATFVIAHFVVKRDAEDLRDDYVREVRANVKFDGVGSFDNWNMEDFEHATLFDNWHNVYTDDDGEPIERVGKFYWKDREDFRSADPAAGDTIPASELRKVSLDYRNRSNDRFKTATTYAGLILFNHVASAVDAMVTARLRNGNVSRRQTSFHLEPEMTPREMRVRLWARRVF